MGGIPHALMAPSCLYSYSICQGSPNQRGAVSMRNVAPAPLRDMVMASTRIMLVDDNNGFLAVAQEYIEASDDFVVVHTASSGEDALALLALQQPDILIVDLSMQGISGLDVARQVKARWPGLPVVILTMYDTALHRQAATEAGADAYVVKTTMDTELVPLLHRLLAN
jgi:DNA-binding NarL/FixJ family response regulator